MEPLMSYEGYKLLQDAPRLHELHMDYLRRSGHTIIDPTREDIDTSLVKKTCVSTSGKKYTIRYSIVNK